MFSHDDVHSLHLDCLSTLPSVTEVHSNGGRLIDYDMLSDPTAAVLHRLDALHLLHAYPTPVRLLTYAPTSPVPIIELMDRECECMVAGVAHLSGNLHLSVVPRDEPGTFEITYSSPNLPAHRRIFVDNTLHYESESLWPSPAFGMDELRARVVYLTVHASLWPVITPDMAPFYHCRHLDIHVEDALPTNEVCRTPFPVVSVLVLQNSPGCTVSMRSEVLSQFQRKWLPQSLSGNFSCNVMGIQIIGSVEA